ncbi:GNAT family N-acetyltransferase [Paenibacillus sp. MER TA 81-3]|uniref:GNAT family N-acetyltransferase n=1 Tax=Paenibacillus sp. MER TA 81-3 TaxID=2939573 RepID=UPI00203B8338|nr:GNAT family N-acetyltransferase [Paenibacillus sp. MER TA 81-3]MCM3339836.1 GNAT family N-acetyltransferase [Paenibacillus sp. MER TA 81-3]
MIRKLTPAEMKALLDSINREQHFLYYSYLTSRKQNAVHYGQFTGWGELLGVLAYLRGLPFHAFSVYPVQASFHIRPLLSFMKQQLQLPDDAVGSFIINEEEMALLASQLEFLKPPKELLLMKHVHQEALPQEDERVVHLGPSHFDQIESKMAELQTMAFTREELRHPFYGVLEHRGLIAVGGYHIYNDDYVELGNIGTDVSWRRQGFGKRVCAELTRKGREVAPHVYLNVMEDNEGAVRLYESLGYEPVCQQYIAEFTVGS